MATATATATDTHPNPTPNPHHRKIDLQSPADLLYLQRNLAAAATERLNLHFPPKHAYATHIPLSPSSSSAGPDPSAAAPTAAADPLRARVEQLVTDFLQRTWEGARHGISVNGLDATTTTTTTTTMTTTTTPGVGHDPGAPAAEREGVDFTYEAYDARLSTRVAGLYAEVEALTGQVAERRRRAPRAGAAAYAARLREAMEADDRWAAEQQGKQEEEARERERAGDVLALPPPLPADVADMYERGLAGLAALSGLNQAPPGGEKMVSLTETVGKVQRARRVVGELE